MNRYKPLSFLVKISSRNLPKQSSKLNFLLSDSSVNINSLRFCTKEADSVIQKSTHEDEETSMFSPVEKIDLSEYGSAIESKFNFAMYADKSPLIQKYIDLGVNLFEIEKYPEKSQYLVKLSLEKIEPYLVFLKEIGVPTTELGKVITNNPFIFKEDLDDLQVRINYLLAKKFNKNMIATIIVRNSKWLSTSVRDIDERLGFLQQSFKLKGDHIREMIVKAPSIALISKKKIILNSYALKEEMGLDEHSLKKVIVSVPRLLRIDSYDLVSTYEYLVNSMKVPVSLVLEQPLVLTYRTFILKERHTFLKSLGRAQYCNLLPGYVNLIELVETSDAEFCDKIAKTSVNVFYDFLKTF